MQRLLLVLWCISLTQADVIASSSAAEQEHCCRVTCYNEEGCVGEPRDTAVIRSGECVDLNCSVPGSVSYNATAHQFDSRLHLVSDTCNSTGILLDKDVCVGVGLSYMAESAPCPESSAPAPASSVSTASTQFTQAHSVTFAETSLVPASTTDGSTAPLTSPEDSSTPVRPSSATESTTTATSTAISTSQITDTPTDIATDTDTSITSTSTESTSTTISPTTTTTSPTTPFPTATPTTTTTESSEDPGESTAVLIGLLIPLIVLCCCCLLILAAVRRRRDDEEESVEAVPLTFGGSRGRTLQDYKANVD